MPLPAAEDFLLWKTIGCVPTLMFAQCSFQRGSVSNFFQLSDTCVGDYFRQSYLAVRNSLDDDLLFSDGLSLSDGRFLVADGLLLKDGHPGDHLPHLPVKRQAVPLHAP